VVDLSKMCAFAMMRINAFLDHELDEETADAIRIHLSNCEECFNEVEIWSTIRSAVQHAYSPAKAPPDLIDKVTSRIKAAEEHM